MCHQRVSKVKRGHRKSCAVNHAADAAVESDIGDSHLARLAIDRILAIFVAPRLKFWMALKSGIVNGDLRVKADESLTTRKFWRRDNREWIHFHKICIRFTRYANEVLLQSPRTA